MKYTVYQHWDPLKICIVGKTYPPEFYSWIKVPHVRSLFEKIAQETEEDLDYLSKKLEEFNVEVLRPELPDDIHYIHGTYMKPPMVPRDFMVMVGDRFYENYSLNFQHFYDHVRGGSWPHCGSLTEFYTLPKNIQQECLEEHSLNKLLDHYSAYNKIYDRLISHGNNISSHFANGGLSFLAPGSLITRIGRDLYHGTHDHVGYTDDEINTLNTEFSGFRNHIIDTVGHSDGVYCPVCPGLIFSLQDAPTYKDTFPGWEVVYLENQSWNLLEPFMDLKSKNQGKWWIPGFEYDNDVTSVIETWMGHWTGYVEETVFDVNMLIVDPKNVFVFSYNKLVFDALERYGITPHIIPMRHRYFWDAGIHCVTTDIHREGEMKDYFPECGL